MLTKPKKGIEHLLAADGRLYPTYIQLAPSTPKTNFLAFFPNPGKKNKERLRINVPPEKRLGYFPLSVRQICERKYILVYISVNLLGLFLFACA